MAFSLPAGPTARMSYALPVEWFDTHRAARVSPPIVLSQGSALAPFVYPLF